MKYVIVDLEMNPVSNEYPNERKVSRLETIQIGAVLLDEKYQEIGSFVTLVKPEYNTRIQKRYEKLTGIKTSMVESAPHFKEALVCSLTGAAVFRMKCRLFSGVRMITFNLQENCR